MEIRTKLQLRQNTNISKIHLAFKKNLKDSEIVPKIPSFSIPEAGTFEPRAQNVRKSRDSLFRSKPPKRLIGKSPHERRAKTAPLK